MTDIIDRIDQAIGCQQCGRALEPGGPSPDFCGESCQEAWHAGRVSARTPAREYGADRAAHPSVAARTAAIQEFEAAYSAALMQLMEPIKLTHEQWGRLLTVCAPTPEQHPVYGGNLGALTGVPVQVVETEAESTPYLERWPGYDLADVIEDYRNTHLGEPEPGWLRRWLNRIRGGAQ